MIANWLHICSQFVGKNDRKLTAYMLTICRQKWSQIDCIYAHNFCVGLMTYWLHICSQLLCRIDDILTAYMLTICRPNRWQIDCIKSCSLLLYRIDRNLTAYMITNQWLNGDKLTAYMLTTFVSDWSQLDCIYAHHFCAWLMATRLHICSPLLYRIDRNLTAYMITICRPNC